MESFNLKKFLIENKLTSNSRLISEAHITPEGDLEELPNMSSSGNRKFDDAFSNLLRIVVDTDSTLHLREGLEVIENRVNDYLDYIRKSKFTGSVTDLINPDTEFETALLSVIKATGREDCRRALLQLRSYISKLIGTYFLPKYGTTTAGNMYYSPENLKNATSDDDLKFMQDYNKKVTTVEKLINGGKVIWDFGVEQYNVSDFKEKLKDEVGKKLYYFYYEIGENLGAIQITPQEAIDAVSTFYGNPNRWPVRLPNNYAFTIYAV